MNFRLSPQKAPRNRNLLPLRWLRYLLLVSGIAALSYCAVVLLDSWGFQAYQTRRFERAIKTAMPRPPRQPVFSLPAIQSAADRAHAGSLGIDGLEGSPLGRLEISSI